VNWLARSQERGGSNGHYGRPRGAKRLEENIVPEILNP
jgi:hypothetical protein